MKNSTEFTDNQLIEAFKNGTATAFESLINRHKDKIFSSILFLVKDKYLAEDLFQDSFIKIIDTIRNNRYNEQGKFLPWAMRIAHNLCVDHFRKVKRETVIKTNNNDFFEMYQGSEEASDKKIERNEDSHQLRQLLDLLPEKQREVLVLRHYGEMNFKEISEITNCSINTALGRMRYSLMNIRKIVAEKQIAF